MRTVTLSAYPLSRAAQPRFGLEVRQTVPREVDQVRGHVVALGLAGVEPPLPGEGDHADERLGVETRELGVVAPRLELPGEDVLDLGGDVADEARERAGRRGDRRVADEDAEAVGVLLDVLQQ